MTYNYEGAYEYNESIIKNWNSTTIGIYYCGYVLANGNLIPLYIGKGTSEGGIRTRLLDHILKDYWPDVTHFGYCLCDTSAEAESFEAQEITRYKPKYNQQGK